MKGTLYPLSLAQQNIYSQEMVASGSDINVLYFVLKAREPLDHGCLERAVNLFVQENDGVRTRLAANGDSLSQYIEPYRFRPLPVEDLRSLTVQEQEETFRRWGHTPFRLLEAPLVDFRLVRLTDGADGLFCKFHHIWCDGWATGLIWSEIFTNYLLLREGKTPHHVHHSPLEFLPADQAYEAGPQFAEDRAFWQAELDGLELSDAVQNPQQRADRSAWRRVFHLPADFSARVKSFAASHSLQPHLLFTAALALSFALRTDARDAVMGMARLNRDSAAERDAVGMFVMELPLRCTPDPEESFLSFCRKLAANASRAARHKKYPLTRIVEDLSARQDLDRNLIDASVSYQKTKIETPGYEFPLDVWFGDPATMLGDLILHVLDLFDGAYTVFYDSRRSLYGERQIRSLHEGLLQMLELAMAEPERALGTFPLVAPRERELLDAFGRFDDLPALSRDTVTDVFARQSSQTPDRCAARGTDGSFTYRELDLRSNAVANTLIARGSQPDTLAAIMLPRGARVLASALGILKAGQGFVFLEPTYPQDRIAYMVEDSAVSCVITLPEYVSLLPEGTPVLFYGDTTGAPETEPEVRAKPESLCYCIYTSGTTGRPKGVLIEHGGLVNLCRPDSCALVEDTVRTGRTILAIGSFSFDISVLEIFPPLLNGVTVCFASQEELDNPARLGLRMQREHANVLYATPSRLLSYLEYAEFRDAVKGLDVVMSGGEAFQPQLWEKLRALSQTVHIVNAYGPTEASIVTAAAEADGPAVTLGQPVRGLAARICGKRGQLLPAGVPGELWVSGVGLARGYRNLPQETEARFVTHEGRRYYRTGDLVQWTETGELSYLGRIDNQVKLRGLRIELGEIEAVLASIEGVSQSCVLLRKEEKAQYLCGFFTASRPIGNGELKAALSRKLPYYMVPSAFLQLPEMPTTQNGKTDRKALAALSVSYSVEYHAPETMQQEKLCSIAARLLDRERVGIDDNFFETGGDSLLAAHLAIEAEAAGIPLKYAAIFSNPTVRLMCESLQEEKVVEERPEIADFDYASLTPLLEWKQEITFGAPPARILLAGATGYLGLHVLRELLEHTKSTMLCLARAKGKLSAEERLKTMLFYYFGESYDDLFSSRLIVVEGDLTRDGIAEGDFPPFDLAINCAADVSHFTYGEAMYEINVGGVRRLAELCAAQKAPLLHISTPTIGQFGLEGRTERRESLTEEDFYFRQDLSNDYAASKFLGEREVLTAVRDGRIRAHILRVGNLQGRFSDGEFQINHAKNAFTARLKAYIELGMAPRSVWESTVDYSPVDCTAELICKFAGAHSDQIIYHIFNDKRTPYRIIFESLEAIGYHVDCVEDDAFQKKTERILADPEERGKLVDIISELTESTPGHFEIDYSCRLTSGILGSSGFHWPDLSREYLTTCLTNLDLLGAFGI